MNFVYILFGVFAITAAKSAVNVDRKDSGKVVVCTATIKSVSTSSKFQVNDIDLKFCTHLICMKNIWDNEIVPWNSNGIDSKRKYERFANLRNQYPHLKVSVAAKYSLDDIIEKADDEESRKELIETATQFVLKNKFDGLDLVFDFSKENTYDQDDTNNIVRLLKELKQSFEPYNFLLTSTFIAAGGNWNVEELKLASFAKHLDYMHIIQKYHYVPKWPQSNHAETVLSDRSLSKLDSTIGKLIKSGTKRSKIVMGVPFVAYAFKLYLDISPKSATFRKAMTYDEICRTVPKNKQQSWEKFYDNDSGLAIAMKEWKNKDQEVLKQTDVYIYENSRSIANKIHFAMNRKLGGVMAMPIDMDDFKGNCGIDEDIFDDFNLKKEIKIPNKQYATHPLLTTIHYVFKSKAIEVASISRIDKMDNLDSKINALDSDTGITSIIPQQYAKYFTYISTINDAMVVGLDMVNKRSTLYEKEQTLPNLAARLVSGTIQYVSGYF